MPKPERGQVLIKVEYAAINPSDIYLLDGFFHKPNVKFEYPYVPGNEGSGEVIQNGGGMLGWSLVGKRVSFSRPIEKLGFFT